MKCKLTKKEQEAREMLCLPLDMDDKDEIIKTVDELYDLVGYFKLNFAFTNHGPEIVDAIKKKGCKIFLDLKFHDIPNTVSGYARAATRMGVDMFNVHAAGGHEMMHAAVTAANEEAEKNCTARPKIIAVTVLTSLDKKTMNDDLGISGSVEDSVLRLARLAESAGLDGVVCSAADLYAVKDKLPKDFLFVTPGVKGVTTAAGSDQKRVFSPANAVKDGSSLLVVGRAITDAPNRRDAALEILQDMAKSL
jgi:orotidine-5'-phosphate decarboxylase